MNPMHTPILRPVGPRSLVLATLVCVLVLAGCGQQSAPVAAQAAKPAGDPLQIQVAPSMASRFKVAEVGMRSIVPIQEVPGRIEANERQVTRIGASVTGRVTELLVEVGDRIKVGQPLARIASPELTQAQMAFVRAHSNAGLAERAVDRARQLFQADVIGAAELQRRESELNLARAELRALSDQLKLLGISGAPLEALRDQGALQSHAPVLATQSGVLLERKISNGQVVQPGEHLFTVADLGNVWVSGALPEQTARSVRMGQQVDIEVPALGNRQLSGRIIYVGDAVSPETRTVPFRTQVDNLHRDLKPQMLATMRIRGEANSELVVPQDAVIREGDRDFVYLKVAESTYRFTPVELAPAHEEFRPVRKGLNPGDQVVIEGAFHLHNERKRAELQ